LGEAGIGKSHLLSELVRMAANRRFRPLVGRCYESEQILPFGPWVDALRTARIASDTETLMSLGTTWRTELARLLPEAGESGSPLRAGSHDFVRLFEAVYQLAAMLSTRAPRLMIIEDLHWADEMSLRLLAFLARRIGGSRVLMVATAREEEVADSPALRRTLEEMDRERAVGRLALGPLSEVDTLSLVRSLAGAKLDLPQLGARIWRASGGNPFMAVETIRAIQEDAGDEGSTALPLPRRVYEVITGRLGRLSRPARQLVAVGAVIGREFDFTLLQRGAHFTRGRTAEALEELVRRRIVHGVGERFDFTHDRIREVAYQEVLAPRRTLLHGQVARALEVLHAANLEPYCGVIGVHYQEAEVRDRALAYLRQGGAHSFGRSASREATRFFERALAALEHLPETRATLEQGIALSTGRAAAGPHLSARS